jgi:hypothetical protein
VKICAFHVGLAHVFPLTILSIPGLCQKENVMTSKRRLGLDDLGSLKLQLLSDRTPPVIPAPKPVTPPSVQAQHPAPKPANIVTAMVVNTRQYDERGFAFAETLIDNTSTRVFLHFSKAVVVEGTHFEPVLTGRRSGKPGLLANAGSRSTQVVLCYQQTDRGYEAISWGVLPKYSPLAEMIRHNDLDRFIGGTVSTASNYGSKPITRYEGTLASGSMSPTEMTIVLTAARRYEPDWPYGLECSGPVTLTFNLSEAYLDPKVQRSADHYTHVVVIARKPSSTQEYRISLRMSRS